MVAKSLSPAVTEDDIDTLIDNVRSEFIDLQIRAIDDPSVGHQISVMPDGRVTQSVYLGVGPRSQREYFGEKPHEYTIDAKDAGGGDEMSDHDWDEDEAGDYIGDLENYAEYASVSDLSAEEVADRIKRGWKRFKLGAFNDDTQLDMWSQQFDREHMDDVREWARENYTPAK